MAHPGSSVRDWLQKYFFQIGNVVTFIFAIVLNALSSLPSRPLGATNADVSAERKTAFTPAGYAFSIWGIIYTLAGLALTWQSLPSQKEFVENKISYFLILNFISNGLWIIAFTTQALSLWLSTILIFFGILASLVMIYMRLKIGENISNVSWGESTMHYFISIYLGWTCVACIANVSLTLVPYRMGNETIWSIVMQLAAFGLGSMFLVRHSDWLAAMPIAWALIAIAVQQESPDYPGSRSTVLSAFTLGGIMWAFSLAVLMQRSYKYFRTQSSPNKASSQDMDDLVLTKSQVEL